MLFYCHKYELKLKFLLIILPFMCFNLLKYHEEVEEVVEEEVEERGGLHEIS